jgi:hypothetical protein
MYWNFQRSERDGPSSKEEGDLPVNDPPPSEQPEEQAPIKEPPKK